MKSPARRRRSAEKGRCVAHALSACRVATRLDTCWCTRSLSSPGVGMSADAARRSACATVSLRQFSRNPSLNSGRPARANVEGVSGEGQDDDEDVNYYCKINVDQAPSPGKLARCQ